MFLYYKTHRSAHHLQLVLIILFLKFNYCELNTSANQTYYSYGQSRNSSNSLRFRDFEPRYSVKAETDAAKTKEIMTLRKHSNAELLSNRKSRGFLFHADDKDVTVELEFVVPFLRIPIERSMDISRTAFRNLLNLNMHSLLTTGAVVAVGGILAIIFKLVFSPFTGFNGFRKTSRNAGENFPYPFDYDNSTEYTKSPVANNFIGFVESKLEENNIDLSKCAQRLICDYVQKSDEKVRTGSATSIQKIIDGILSLKAINSAMKGTGVQEAVDAAKNDIGCSTMYGKCTWNATIQNVVKSAVKLMKYLNFT